MLLYAATGFIGFVVAINRMGVCLARYEPNDIRRIVAINTTIIIDIVIVAAVVFFAYKTLAYYIAISFMSAKFTTLAMVDWDDFLDYGQR